jgi:hypothetical protein
LVAEVSVMIAAVAVLAGMGVAFAVLGRWIGRHLREVDDYFEREYREPPVWSIPDSHGSAL